MRYTYFTRKPDYHWRETHLFSLVHRPKHSMLVCIPFPTMVVEVWDEQFVRGWSDSTRTKINKAVKEELVADRGNHLLPDILTLFGFTAERKGLKGYRADDFNTFSKIECSAVMLDGTMLCGHVWLIDEEEGRALLYVNASNQGNENDDASLTGRAHYFLLWQDGLYLRKLGIKMLDLQGFDPESTDPQLKGIYQWKAGTHGKQEMLYHYYPVWFYVLRKIRQRLKA